MDVASIDRRRLAKDTLCAISQFCTGRKFVGHDGTEYSIRGDSDNAEMKYFIELTAKVESMDKAVARYAVVLIGLSER